MEEKHLSHPSSLLIPRPLCSLHDCDDGSRDPCSLLDIGDSQGLGDFLSRRLILFATVPNGRLLREGAAVIRIVRRDIGEACLGKDVPVLASQPSGEPAIVDDDLRILANGCAGGRALIRGGAG